MRQHYKYKCPRCGYHQTISLDLEPGAYPKYAPTHVDKDKHHSRDAYVMELVDGS